MSERGKRGRARAAGSSGGTERVVTGEGVLTRERRETWKEIGRQRGRKEGPEKEGNERYGKRPVRGSEERKAREQASDGLKDDIGGA